MTSTLLPLPSSIWVRSLLRTCHNPLFVDTKSRPCSVFPRLSQSPLRLPTWAVPLLDTSVRGARRQHMPLLGHTLHSGTPVHIRMPFRENSPFCSLYQFCLTYLRRESNPHLPTCTADILSIGPRGCDGYRRQIPSY